MAEDEEKVGASAGAEAPEPKDNGDANAEAAAPEEPAAEVSAAEPAAEESAAEAGAAEITAPLRGQRPSLKRLAGAMWSLGRALFAVEDELDKRPHGRFYHGMLAMVPVVGAFGKYLGEWSGLKRAAHRAEEWLAAHPQAAGTR